MRVWEVSERGPVRYANEDRTGSVRWPGGGAVVVADGMGANSATDAAAVVVEAVCAHYREAPPLTRLAPASADLAVRSARTALAERSDPGGSTVVMLVVHEGRGLLAWAGDCRAYRQRGRTLSKLTTDHTLVERMVEDGRISAAEAATHPHRHIVLRSVMAADPGADGGLETRELSVEPGDRYLLATDGAWRPLELWTLQQHMMVGEPDLPDAAAAIVAAAHAEDGSDNAAVAVISGSDGDD